MQIHKSCQKVTVKQYGGMWDPRKMKKVKQKYQKQRCQKYSKCGNNTRVYCYFYKGLLLLSGYSE